MWGKYFTTILILAFLFAFVVVAISVNDIRFLTTLVYLMVAAIVGYTAINYIDHLNVKYMMDTIMKMFHKKATDESQEECNDQDKKNKHI